MTKIPQPALILGLAGLLPFALGAVMSLGGLPNPVSGRPFSPVTGLLLLQSYGLAILAFLGGCLWGFAAPKQPTWREMGVSVLPALWAVGASMFSPNVFVSLIFGFVITLAFDLMWRLRGLAPAWWIPLRLILTAGAVACLAVPAIFV